MSEFDSEPVPGLPARLPPGETMLWQGAPDWRRLALQAFHVRAIGLYFGALALWRLVAALHDGATLADTAVSLATLAVMAAATIGFFCALALGVARTTLYTLTNRRIVMRIGVALPVTYNLPFQTIESAAVRAYADGTGDVPLTLRKGDKLSYAILWPHVRPWRFSRPEPMLRCVPEVAALAEQIAQALAETPQLAPRTASPAATRPEPIPVRVPTGSRAAALSAR